jgi:hypothetical protein
MEGPQDSEPIAGSTSRFDPPAFDYRYPGVGTLYLPSEMTYLLLQIVDSIRFASMFFALGFRRFDLCL